MTQKELMHEDLKACLKVLESGGVILYPTDTIWGIGCDATNTEAVKKVYAIKQRSDAKSMLILLDRAPRLENYVSEVPDMAWELIEMSDKPMTIIYDNVRNVSEALMAEDGSVGIRITSEEFTHKLIERFKKPIVSTSANCSGAPSPANFSEIDEDLKNKVDYVVKYRQDDTKNLTASSIIKLTATNQITIIRK